MRSVLNRIGRKRGVLPIITGYFPIHFNTYIEPFVGSGDVYFGANLTHDIECHINDIDPMIADAFSLIKMNPEKQETHEKIETQESVEKFINCQHSDPYDRLRSILYIQTCCFGSMQKGNNIVRRPFHPVDWKLEQVPKLSYYMKNTEVHQGDWKQMMTYDSPDTFFFLDPPYDNSKGMYKNCSMDYEDMASTLKSIHGKFLLTLSDTPAMRYTFRDFHVSGYAVAGRGAYNKGSHIRKELCIRN
jgi:DNA adenine methylase